MPRKRDVMRPAIRPALWTGMRVVSPPRYPPHPQAVRRRLNDARRGWNNDVRGSRAAHAGHIAVTGTDVRLPSSSLDDRIDPRPDNRPHQTHQPSQSSQARKLPMTNPNPFSTDPFGRDPADGTNTDTGTGSTGYGVAGNAYSDVGNADGQYEQVPAGNAYSDVGNADGGNGGYGVSTPPSYPPQGSQINPYATPYATQPERPTSGAQPGQPAQAEPFAQYAQHPQYAQLPAHPDQYAYSDQYAQTQQSTQTGSAGLHDGTYATQPAPSDDGTDRTDQTGQTGQTDQTDQQRTRQRTRTSTSAFQSSRTSTGSGAGGTGGVDGTATDAPPLDEPYYGCPPQEAFLRFFKKYVTVSGRASRSEYWWWMLIAFGIALVLRFLSSATDGTLGFLGTIWTLGTLIPGFAIAIRRLHDSNRPGWLVVTPYALWFVGAIFILGGAASALFGAIGSLGGGTGHAAAGVGGGIALLIGVIAVLAGFVVNIVLMVAPSKPEGARFDAV
ncbi:hypothetical protein COO72_10350 [Bifidobacterium callitrichos]|nr:hypothetical protein COO72_10350 [Bifidobacterium callitrichos]